MALSVERLEDRLALAGGDVFSEAVPVSPTITTTSSANHLVTAVSGGDSSFDASVSNPLTEGALPAAILVTTAADEDDGTADPAQGTGTSLREAIKAANANPGLDYIAFDIPGSGVHTISPATALPAITDAVIIDGYTQPGASLNTLSVGDNAMPLIEIDGQKTGFQITGSGASGSSIKGLVINDIGEAISAISITNSSNNTIAGNFLGLKPDGTTVNTGSEISDGISIKGGSGNVIGGSAPADRNVIASSAQASIYIGTGSSGNFVQGNYIGVDRTGAAALPIFQAIDLDQSDNNTVGGIEPGAGNVIGNWGGGQAAVNVYGTDGSIVQGNLIGTNASGTALLNQTGIPGVVVSHSTNSIIGGSALGAGNVISGASYGIGIGHVGSGTVIQGNKIGTDITGTKPIGNSAFGIWLGKANDGSGGLIGGTSPGEGNIIAFNGKQGVLMAVGSGWSILGNSIFANGTLGIDLSQNAGVSGTVGDGVTPNDLTPTPDADAGPNNLQNFPVISYATRDAGELTVTYNVPSNPANSSYPIRVEFFKADASGQQGQTYLGFDAFTAADFAGGGKTITLPGTTAANVLDKIVATATDSLPAGGPANTSEFSPGVLIASPWQNPANNLDVDDDRSVAPSDALAIINFLNSSGSQAVPNEASNSTYFYDVSGDNFVAPNDALQVINYINANGLGATAEGENAPPAGTSTAQPAGLPGDLLLLLAMDVADQASCRKRIATGGTD